MSFLTPLVLLGLAALAVPVLIHLIQRERKRVVQFPSLMFLQRIPYPSVRRRRIHNWLLLCLRLAALALIVAAFSRPFLNRPGLTAAGTTGAREVVMLVDTSYSMGYGDRWERAVAAVRTAINGLEPADRASLVFFATGAEAAVRSSGDRGALAAAVDATRPGAGATRYGPALKLAQSTLIDSQLPRREVVLVSDFQRTGWRRDDSVRLPEGTLLTPVPVGDEEAPNVTVASVNFQRAVFSGQERVTVGAAIINRGPDDLADRRVALEVNGREVQDARVSIEAGSSASVTFAPFTLTGPNTRGSVRTTSDSLAIDDAFHFVLGPTRAVPVVIVERNGAASDASLYLARAMGVGTSPSYQVEVVTPDRLTNSVLEGKSVVVLNDAPVADAGLVARLTGFVERGGGLLLVLGERSAWPAARADVLPGALGPPVDRSTGRPAVVGGLDYSHPVFELFKAPRSGDFSSARFYRYRSLAASDGASVLARFDDGAVALAERRVGQGRVLVWASSLDNFWNDLVLKPVFLPFVHRMTRHLAQYVDPVPWLTVGQVIDPQRGTSLPGGSGEPLPPDGVVALTPSGDRVELGGEEGPLELQESGFYTIRLPNAGAAETALAVNVDVAESDLTPLDAQELAAAVSTHGGAGPDGPTEADVITPEEQERRQAVWWYLLLLGVLLLAGETVLSNRLSRKTS